MENRQEIRGLLATAAFFIGCGICGAAERADSGAPQAVASVRHPHPVSTDGRPVVDTGFETGVSGMGAATFSFPIRVPEGINGLQPQLAVTYDSQSGKGIVGTGCSLTGTSAIVRTTTDVAHDGTARGLAYDWTDAFTLDGKRLILVSGTAGEEGAEYRMEDDSFSKIQLKTAADGTLYFDVLLREGMLYTYGMASDSRQTQKVKGEDVACGWHVDQADDAYGNFMTYAYLHSGGLLYPEEIVCGLTIVETKAYDASGNVVRTTREEGGVMLTTDRTYDTAGRLLSETSSNGRTCTYAYGDRTIRATENGHPTTTVSDAMGNVRSVSSPSGTITYTYASPGAPSEIATPDATSYLSYDGQGRRTYIDDPDGGPKGFTYDLGGRFVSSLDYKGNTENCTYDTYHRLKQRTCNGLSTDYPYATGINSDLPAYVRCGDNALARAYDRLGRVVSEARRIGDKGILTHSYAYAEGVLTEETFPNDLSVGYGYDADGNVERVSIGGRTVWQRLTDTGTERTEQWGNRLTRRTLRNAHSLLTAQTLEGDGRTLHAMLYTFDGATGNLTSRTGMQAEAEVFAYDSEHRLTAVSCGTQSTARFSYGPTGNILSKDRIGSYAYDGIAPHAVTEVDNTDGLLPADAQQISYTGFNKAERIRETVGGQQLEYTISYGPDRQRWMTQLTADGSVRRTILYGDGYERIERGDTVTHICYLSADGQLFGLYVQQNGTPGQLLYAVTDHLGSIVSLVDSAATTMFAASYDAWGRRTVTTDRFHLLRGFTGHEHLEEFGLIDMNGRMYDPALGRFLSPDPYVQMPDDLQNYNRYSYCLNNPLKYTDPSGEFIVSLISNIVMGAIIGSVTSMAAYSISTLVTGQSWSWGGFFQAAGVGAVSGAIGGVSSFIGSTLKVPFVGTWGFNLLSNTTNNMVTNGIFGNKPSWDNILPIIAGSAVGSAMPNLKHFGDNKLLAGVKDIAYNTTRGFASGMLSGISRAYQKQDINAFMQDMIGSSASAFVRSSLINVIFGSPKTTKIGKEYVAHRSGGITDAICKTWGITLGNNMYSGSDDPDNFTTQVSDLGFKRL